MAKKKTTQKKPAAKRAKTKRAKAKTTKAVARKPARATTKRKQAVKKSAKKSAAKPTKKPATKKTTAKKTAKHAVVKSKKSVKKSTRKRVKPAKATHSRAARVPQAAKPTRARKLKSRLTPSEVDDFRIMLLQKRHELVGDMTTLTEEALHKNSHEVSGNLSNMPQHMAELGSDNYEQEFALILVDGERALLKEIDEALQRIANGGFGICEATGKPIRKARLRAKPWAKYCYEYVLAQETGQLGRY